MRISLELIELNPYSIVLTSLFSLVFSFFILIKKMNAKFIYTKLHYTIHLHTNNANKNNTYNYKYTHTHTHYIHAKIHLPFKHFALKYIK